MENELWEFKIFVDTLNNICCIQKKKNILKLGSKWFTNGYKIGKRENKRIRMLVFLAWNSWVSDTDIYWDLKDCGKQGLRLNIDIRYKRVFCLFFLSFGHATFGMSVKYPSRAANYWIHSSPLSQILLMVNHPGYIWHRSLRVLVKYSRIFLINTMSQ